MRMMRIRGVWTTNAVALLLGFGMYSSFILLPQFVETPTRRRLRLRRVRDQARALPPAVDARDAGRRLADRPAREALRLQAAAARRRRLRVRRPSRCSPSRAASSGRSTSPSLLLGSRHRPGLRGDGEPDHRERRAGETGVATGMNTVTRTVGGAFGGAATASMLASTVGTRGSPPTRASPPRSPCARAARHRRPRRPRDPAAPARAGLRAARSRRSRVG